MKLSEQLKKLREDKGYSFWRTARESEIAEWVIIGIEKQDDNLGFLTAESIKKLAKFYKVKFIIDENGVSLEGGEG